MNKEVNIVFTKPKKFEDCVKCISHIKKDGIVHINLSELDEKQSQRVLDYISGAVYIKDGEIKDIGGKMFCAIPKNVHYQFDYGTNNNNLLDEEEEIIPIKR